MPVSDSELQFSFAYLSFFSEFSKQLMRRSSWRRLQKYWGKVRYLILILRLQVQFAVPIRAASLRVILTIDSDRLVPNLQYERLNSRSIERNLPLWRCLRSGLNLYSCKSESLRLLARWAHAMAVEAEGALGPRLHLTAMFMMSRIEGILPNQ